jgi:hypothetical protein
MNLRPIPAQSLTESEISCNAAKYLTRLLNVLRKRSSSLLSSIRCSVCLAMYFLIRPPTRSAMAISSTRLGP